MGFKVYNGCIVEPGILLARLQKKIENLLFLENLVIEQTSSKCRGLSVHTLIVMSISTYTAAFDIQVMLSRVLLTCQP